MSFDEPDPLAPRRSEARIGRDHFELLLEVTERLVRSLDLDELPGLLLEGLVRTFRVERGLVLLAGAPGGELEIRESRNLEGAALEEARAVSRRVVEAVRREGKAILVEDVRADQELAGLSSLGGAGVRGLVCHPLLDGAEVLGVVYLDNRSGMNPFTPSARAVLGTLCNLAAVALARARRHREVVRENRTLRRELDRRTGFETLVGASPAMLRLYDRIESVAPLPVGVLVLGESGTGKELVARAIHSRSGRRDAPFVAVNCAALPESLAESEVFGHRKGSFTGADADHAGLFEEAEGGTIFLDEISSTTPAFQAKLLRVLQESEVVRVGEARPRKVDVRVVCATNEDLPAAISKGRFREDLYYRIKVVDLAVPPLRERIDDLPLLVEHFVAKYDERFRKSVRGVTPEAMTALRSHRWPGNVRELENAVQRAIAVGTGDLVDVEDLGLDGADPGEGGAATSFRQAVRAFEKDLIARALAAAEGNVAAAARSLGMSRQQLHTLVQRHELGR